MLDIRKTETDSQREGSLVYSDNSRTLDFSLDLNSVGFIMSRLTDLYKDRVSSVVRELISNAIDATLRAGRTTCIEVTLPVSDDGASAFAVRDYGTGMSLEELEAVYTKYGASTKRDDLNQVGSFGLGAKVPFAYADQFTIKTVKDGVEITGLLRKTEKFAELVILSERRTDEPTGTIICVPVENRADFGRFATAVEIYLENEAVMSVPIRIINDAPLNYIPKDWVEVDTPELGLLKIALKDEHIIFNHISNLLGFSIEERFLHLEQYIQKQIVFVLEGYEYTPSSSCDVTKRFFIKVEPGYFDFISSREELNETARTVSNMESIIKAVAKKLPEVVLNKIDAGLEGPNSQVLSKIKKNTKRYGRTVPDETNFFC